MRTWRSAICVVYGTNDSSLHVVKVWRLDISTVATLADCSCWRLIPIGNVRDALLEMTDDVGEARRAEGETSTSLFRSLPIPSLYRCAVEPLLGPLLTLSASSIGTRCQDTEVITPCTRACGYCVAEWEPITSNSALPRAKPALHGVVVTRLSHIRRSHRFAIGEFEFV